MKHSIGVVAVLFLLTLATGCGKDDETDFESIVGTWEGTLLKYEFTPSEANISYKDSDEDFDAVIEFRADGSVAYKDGSDESIGTYTINGNKLETTISLTDDLPISSGTFTIKKLTKTQLTLFIEDDIDFEIPGLGELSGEVQATIYFERQ